jgi:drug/metabolite transporter (DMT)-like permease
MTSEHLGELAAMGTALSWTLSTLAWTAAGRHIGAIAVSSIRLALAMLYLMAYRQLVHGSALPAEATAQTWTILGLSGLMGFFVSDICLFKAFLLIGPRLSLLVLSLTPPLSAILSWVFLGEGLLARHWLAMGITLGGIIWVVLEQPESEPLPHVRRQLRQGLLLATVAAAAQAAGFVLSRKGIGSYDAPSATLIRAIGGMAGYLVLVTLLGRWRPVLRAAAHRRAMPILMLGTLAGPVVGVVLFMIAVRHCNAGVVSTIVGTMPVLILPFTILLHREPVSLRAVGGALVSVAGVALLVL